MKNESLQNYDNSLFAKIVRKIVSFGEKMPRLSAIIIKNENIDEFIVKDFNEFLEILDTKLIEDLKFRDKALFLSFARDIEEGNLRIDFKDAEEEEFFELNPFVDFFIQKGEKYICINKDNMYIDDEISKYKVKETIARSFIYYMSDKTMYKKEFGFKYKFLNQAINEMLTSYILDKEYEKNLRQIEILKKFLTYNKKYDENKLFESYLEGDFSYLNKLIDDNILHNLDVILEAENTFSIDNMYQNEMHNLDRINKLYINHVLNQNTKKIKDIKTLDYEKLYEKYFNLTKDLINDSEYINKVCLEKILEDVSLAICSQSKTPKEAVKEFINVINDDIVYREDYNNIEGKNLILKQILKIRSTYNEDVSLENNEIFNSYIDAKNSLNKSKLEIEEETGRCIIKMCKDVKRIYKPKEIVDGKEVYTKESMLSHKVGRKTTKVVTFIYDGTIKDEKETQKICETKFNLNIEKEKNKFNKMFLNKITQYKDFITEIKEEEDQKIKIFNEIYSDYISKYISKRKNNLSKEGKKKQKEYVANLGKKDNTMIIQEVKKIPEDEFLKDVEKNTSNILKQFERLNEMYNGV